MFLLCLKSSHAMGMGHLFRMINLYGTLRQNGTDAIIMLLGEHPPASEWLKRASIPFEEVTDQTVAQPGWEAGLAVRYGAKVWVNDRLQTDEDHAIRIKELGLRLVTFDDLGSGARLADLHVAALAGVRGENPQGTKVLTGVKYLMLPPEISHFRRQRTIFNSWVVSLGGSDTHGVTVRVAQWLSSRQQHATLILGPGFDHNEMLSKIIGNGITEKRSVPSLAAEFAEHDLAITGGGLTAFEAAAAGLPTVIVANEEWEVAHCLYLQNLGCSIFAGPYENIDLSVLERPLDIPKMSMAALDVFDMEGINRVRYEIMSLLN
jgi:spore coat polysaccharide biosynthesis predicted glycosyltransferase SpsG